ncbi:MAG: hypothetical protein RLZZ50_1587 [Verrucomicrobiota bacterium]|jgi:hypothetical protein
MKAHRPFVLGLLFAAPFFTAAPAETVAKADLSWAPHAPDRPKPPRAEPLAESALLSRSRPPADAIVLFNGLNGDAWLNPGWIFTPDHIEIAPSTKGMLATKQSFGSCRLHLEWWAPDLPPDVRGQKRSNSGVFFMGRYEVQILDTFDGSQTYADGQAGAIYGQFPPLANALRPAGNWQYYDITFHRPVFGADGALLRPARMTVEVNGVKVQDNAELTGPTVHKKRPPYAAHPDRLPLSLQNHDDVIRFRNIWLVPIND